MFSLLPLALLTDVVLVSDGVAVLPKRGMPELAFRSVSDSGSEGTEPADPGRGIEPRSRGRGDGGRGIAEGATHAPQSSPPTPCCFTACLSSWPLYIVLQFTYASSALRLAFASLCREMQCSCKVGGCCQLWVGRPDSVRLAKPEGNLRRFYCVIGGTPVCRSAKARR